MEARARNGQRVAAADSGPRLSHQAFHIRQGGVIPLGKRWEEKYDQDIIDQVLNRGYSADAVTVKDDEDYAEILQNQKSWQFADEPGKTSLHDQNEAIRAKYNYSGGDNGDKYIPIEKTAYTPQPFSYSPGAAAAAVNSYRTQLDALEASIMNRDPFSYDYRTDPSWQSYKKQYTREGRRSSEDVMGQYAAMTGGMPSTAAVAAAQQAADYYNARMTDMIPQLYQAAWDRYQDEGNQYLRNWNMLNTGYQAAVSQENADRNFQWNQYQDALDRAYQAERDAIGDSRYADETAYNRGVYEDETQYSRDQAQLSADRQRLLDYLAAGGSLEALDSDSALSDLVERSGYSTAELTALRDQAAKEEAQRQQELQAAIYKAYNPSGKNPTEPEETVTGNKYMDYVLEQGMDEDEAYNYLIGVGGLAKDRANSLINLYMKSGEAALDRVNDYQSALSWMNSLGAGKNLVSGLASRREWETMRESWMNRDSSAKSARDAEALPQIVRKYNSYEDYLRAYCEYVRDEMES